MPCVAGKMELMVRYHSYRADCTKAEAGKDRVTLVILCLCVYILCTIKMT